ncbi:MAG: Baseplate protein [Chloroflexota bacterium]|nr:Baseplate protein [Chloroflexota bacterium]
MQTQLFAQLKKDAYDRLSEKIGPGTFVPPESVSYLALSPTFTPFVGEVASELTLNMTVQAVGLSVDTRAAQTIGLSRLQDAMPPGTRLISDSVRFIPGAVSVPDEKTVKFELTSQGVLLRGIDREAVRSVTQGLSVEEATVALMARFQLAQPPEIHLGPDWLPYIVPVNLPRLPWRIRVIINWDGAAQLAMKK